MASKGLQKVEVDDLTTGMYVARLDRDWLGTQFEVQGFYVTAETLSELEGSCRYVYVDPLDNIPNLPRGSFAVYTKMHHSLVDGAGGASFMAALHDLVPNPTEAPEEEDEPVLVAAAQHRTEPQSSASMPNRLARRGTKQSEVN